jgi:hypothetical protein
MSGPSRKDQEAAAARRVQATTWTAVTVVWIVTATVVLLDDGSSPVTRTVFAVAGLIQVAAALVWLRAGRNGA